MWTALKILGLALLIGWAALSVAALFNAVTRGEQRQADSPNEFTRPVTIRESAIPRAGPPSNQGQSRGPKEQPVTANTEHALGQGPVFHRIPGDFTLNVMDFDKRSVVHPETVPCDLWISWSSSRFRLEARILLTDQQRLDLLVGGQRYRATRVFLESALTQHGPAIEPLALAVIAHYEQWRAEWEKQRTEHPHRAEQYARAFEEAALALLDPTGERTLLVLCKQPLSDLCVALYDTFIKGDFAGEIVTPHAQLSPGENATWTVTSTGDHPDHSILTIASWHPVPRGRLTKDILISLTTHHWRLVKNFPNDHISEEWRVKNTWLFKR
jgi:hypothetical protein